MTKCLLSIYDYLSKRKWFVSLLLGLIGIGCVLFAMRLDYEEDIASFLPLDEQTEKYAQVYNNLGGQNKIVVLFKAPGKLENRVEEIEFSITEFCNLLSNLDTIGCVRKVQAQYEEERAMAMLSFIWQNYPYLLSQGDVAKTDSLLKHDSSFVERQMELNFQMLQLPTGRMTGMSMPYDPLHLSVPVTNRLQAMSAMEDFQVIDGYIFSKEGDKGLVFLESNFGTSETQKNAALVDLLEQVSNLVENKVANSNISITCVGAPLIAVYNARQIKEDSTRAIAIAVVLILAVLIVSFKRYSDILWIGISLSFGWLFAIGCISLWQGSISLIVIGISSIIIGIAVNYPLHFIDHLGDSHSVRTALRDMVQPLLIGNITTVSAFLCLVFLDAEAIQDLGVFSSLMLTGTILFVLVFLPQFISIPKTKNRAYIERGADWTRFATIPHRYYRHFFIAVLLLTGGLFVFSQRTSFDADMQHINYMPDNQREGLTFLSNSMAGTGNTRLMYITANGNSVEEALQNNEKALDAIRNMKGINALAGVDGLIPSMKKQADNVARWQTLMKDNPGVVDKLKSAYESYGFSPLAFIPFEKMANGELAVRDSRSFVDSLRLIAEHYIQQDETGVRIVNCVAVEKENYEETKSMIRNRLPADVFAFDSSDISSHLVKVLSDSFDYIGLVCGIVVFFFLWVSFGRLELSLLSFLPLAIGWIWILGFMGLLDIRFNIVNIILATFIFGQGDDYAIFITEGLVYEYAYGRKLIGGFKRSVALSGLLMFIGLGALIIARHPAIRSLAEVAIIGMVIVVAMAFYLPPLIFEWVTKTHGVVREYPLTIKRVLRSLYALLAFLLGVLSVMPVIYVYKMFHKKQEDVSLFIHIILYRFSKFVIHRIPGTVFKVVNPHNEDFSKPALIICNHQSQLDLMAVLSLTEKITILTKEWVWNNPYYGSIIRSSEFYPITNGIDSYTAGMQQMVKRGYSIVVFPEGTRSAGGIKRFHKGAFMLAKQLGLDILPIYLHGFNDILPRHDFMLREGSMTMEIGARMPAREVGTIDSLELRSYFHRQYVVHFAEMKKLYENSRYFIPQVKYKYMYKGLSVERRCRENLSDVAKISKMVDRDYSSVESYVFDDPGQGEIPFIFAKVHPTLQVYADFDDEDDYLIAIHIADLPPNLHYALSSRS